MSTRQTDDEGREVWGRFALSIAGMSHVGRVRQANEDAFDRFDDASRSEILLVVADGMGGHRGGAVASAMAVGTLGSLCLDGEADAPSRLASAIQRANAEIFERASGSRLYTGMGTTVVALLLSPGGASYVAHVGDSRLYRLRDGLLRPVTTDHSLAAQLLANGEISEEEARTHPRRSILTRSLGVARRVDVEVARVDVCHGDAFVLCSDGIYEMLPDDEMCSLVASAPDAHTAAAWLIDAANQHGGKDNSTALVVQVSGAA